MASSPSPHSARHTAHEHVLTKSRLISIAVLLSLLILCLVFAWVTRDSMRNLPTLVGQQMGVNTATGKSLVDQSPWQTAQALAPLAVTAEEIQFARESERLADHAVDQAFAAALRQAALDAEHQTLTGTALALSQKVAQLQQAVAADQAQVKQLTDAQATAGSSNAPKGAVAAAQAAASSNLDIAKAQLELDSNELSDAQQDLGRASGDQQAEIQNELTAHEEAMKKYVAEVRSGGEVAVLNAARYGTLAGRIAAWNKQRQRLALIQQAAGQARTEITSLTAKHDALEKLITVAAQASTADSAVRLASIRDSSARRQLMSIYDDDIQTEQRLASVYDRWAAQVQSQHRILIHLMLQSLSSIAFILICMVVGDGLARKLMSHPGLDWRRRQTLRAILELSIQIIGIVCILIVIFGAPQQTTTMLGLATAALTIALQDFVLAFFGWFVLMGKKGMHVGDVVEINNVGGQVMEIGLMSTTLMETGGMSGSGHATGRRITFMNSFAIRGQYFNFSTDGQWMWDSFDVAVPFGYDIKPLVDKIDQVVRKETEEDARQAETEWKRGLRGDKLGLLSTDAGVSLKLMEVAFHLNVYYVTRASDRSAMRIRLYKLVSEIVHEAVYAPGKATA